MIYKKTHNIRAGIQDLAGVLIKHVHNGEWGNAARIVDQIQYGVQYEVDSNFELSMFEEAHNEAKGMPLVA